ncbi:MAG: LOG family protein [Ottowia sp.]|nr:LOG family protein [Ottowia sp.]
MHTTDDLKESAPRALARVWSSRDVLEGGGIDLQPHANRLAFADPEFLLRTENRGIRFQLELAKPDLDLAAAGVESTIVVYGSARFLAPDVAQRQLAAARTIGDAAGIARAERAAAGARYYVAAREFARCVARYSKQQEPAARFYICTGGGPGIMAAANRGAHDEGMPSVGLNITLPHEQGGNPWITPELSFKFHYFALRKMHFLMRAKALVAFPGGLGTLDELFEVLTLVQTRKVQPVPVVLYGRDYWSHVLPLEYLVEVGTIDAEDLELYHVVDTVDDAWQVIQDFYALPPARTEALADEG